MAVGLELGALVAQEELVHMGAERLGDQLGALHHLDGLLQAARQGPDAEHPALPLGQRPDVVLGLRRQLELALDAVQARRQRQGVRQVRVGRRVDGAQLDTGRAALVRLVHRHPDQGGTVVATPADEGRGLVAVHQTLVRVDPLVGDRGDLGGMGQQTGDEVPPGLGEVVLRRRVVEDVVVALEQGHVGVHARARLVGERLGHERRPYALAHRDLLHHHPEGHDVVGHRQGVGVAQVDLLLARPRLVVGELDRDAHLLEHGDRGPAEVGALRLGGVVEVAGVVDRRRLPAGLTLRLDQEELDLRVTVERVAHVRGPRQGALEHIARVGPGRRPVGVADVTEHPGRPAGLLAPRQQLEGGRVGVGDHVGFIHAGEALDRRPVEADALVERALELGGSDRDGLQEPQHVGEPETYESDIALLERSEHVLGLLVHADSLPLIVFQWCVDRPSGMTD
ncbi:hypothetical protein SDC9_92125 [bioreactor metagenome]|uniref:Uncharacterized protein n=1 Tax=bioreactor metagenome TaxID=1076179 RepID=A0A644ZYD4_9ZZZZ